MIEPSKMSVMSQICWKVPPFDQQWMTSIKEGLKLSTYSSELIVIPSSLLICHSSPQRQMAVPPE
jgi:hypothetical protein